MRFSLRSLLFGSTLFTIFVAGAYPVWKGARAQRIESEIRNALKCVYIAISCFDSARDRLPAPAFKSSNGTQLSSWRFRVLPYWGVNDLGRNRYDAAWNAPVNQKIRTWAPDFYCLCAPQLTTNFFALSGPDAAFESGPINGVGRVSLKNVSDDLVLVMEVADSKTHRMQPGDYDVAKLLAATGKLGDTIKGLLPDRIHLLFADGEVWALSPDAPIDALKPFLTIEGAKTASREKQLAPHRVDE